MRELQKLAGYVRVLKEKRAFEWASPAGAAAATFIPGGFLAHPLLTSPKGEEMRYLGHQVGGGMIGGGLGSMGGGLAGALAGGTLGALSGHPEAAALGALLGGGLGGTAGGMGGGAYGAYKGRQMAERSTAEDKEKRAFADLTGPQEAALMAGLPLPFTNPIHAYISAPEGETLRYLGHQAGGGLGGAMLAGGLGNAVGGAPLGLLGATAGNMLGAYYGRQRAERLTARDQAAQQGGE